MDEGEVFSAENIKQRGVRNVYLTVKLFETGVFNKEETLRRLKVFRDYEVFDYIQSFYDVLHSTGPDYMVEDIEFFIESRQH